MTLQSIRGEHIGGINGHVQIHVFPYLQSREKRKKIQINKRNFHKYNELSKQLWPV